MEVEEKKGEKRWIVGGDFNAWTGERGQMEKGDEEGKRRLKDKGINKKGEELIKWIGGRVGNNERGKRGGRGRRDNVYRGGEEGQS